MTPLPENHQPPDALPVPPLEVAVPPMLEAALGWDGDARYVSFFWTPYGDELCYATGREQGTLHGWWCWTQFIRHPPVAHALRRVIPLYALGSSETDATHWLVLDRERRQLCVLPVREAQAFQTRQWSHPGHVPPMEVSAEELHALAHAVMSRLARRAVVANTRQPQAAHGLAAWLAQHGA